jgi:integrase
MESQVFGREQTILALDRLPAKLVQERLGHSNISMTLDVYWHLFPHGDDGGALNRAEEALLG